MVLRALAALLPRQRRVRPTAGEITREVARVTDRARDASPKMPPFTPKAAPPPIWSCQMRTIACRFGHPKIDVRESSGVAEYRVDGHVYFSCKTCSPTTHAFGVASRYHGIITLYAITREQLDHILALPDHVGTLEILRLLGYHHEAA